MHLGDEHISVAKKGTDCTRVKEPKSQGMFWGFL